MGSNLPLTHAVPALVCKYPREHVHTCRGPVRDHADALQREERAAAAARLSRPVAELRRHHAAGDPAGDRLPRLDRKSTRLNSSHVANSYAVFCLKKKNDYRPQEQNIKKKK